MIANILNMPPELIEHTVHDLGLTDIRNLRLSCRGLCEKSSHRFKTFFAHRTTNLSEKSLTTLVKISQHIDLAPTSRLDEIIESGTMDLVELEQTEMNTSTTTVESIQEQLEVLKAERDLILQKISDQAHVQTAGTDISMLRIIFHNLKSVPLALSFEVDIQEEIVRHPADLCSDLLQLWKRTSRTFITAMTAVAQSGLALCPLHVYSGEWGGALSVHDLHAAIPQLKADGITTALASLQKLYICLAPYVPEEDNIEKDSVQQVNTEPENSPNNEHHMALAELLSLASSVEELDVHGFNVSGQSSINLDSVVKKVPLHKLEKCTFREVYMEENSLMHILRNNPHLKSLCLKRIVLACGSWKNVFNYLAPVCTSTRSSNPAGHEIDSSLTASCKLNVVVFDTLYSSPTGRLLSFLHKDGQNASLGFLHHRIEIPGADLCHEIQYEIRRGRPKGSAALYRWRNENKIEFGPF